MNNKINKIAFEIKQASSLDRLMGLIDSEQAELIYEALRSTSPSIIIKRLIKEFDL